MGKTRRLPEDAYRRLERLGRDNWRTQVSTAPVLGGGDDGEIVDPTSGGDLPGVAVSWVDVIDRLDALEQRMNNLEGVDESG